ncbi:MAG: hypothetical protein CL908_12435 [Deltaproteobacteria bacterium]|nr:hypothetical protein [Deltaproteobacteria bacterium]
MIFVTVGAQMSFDRLIGWVDDWAESVGRDDLVAQIGPSDYVPQRLKVLPFLTPPEFRSRIAEADFVIAHAGMGSIIEALELATPIVVVPRLGSLGETRNDHQVATARRLTEEGLVLSAQSPEELAEQLAIVGTGGFRAHISDHAQTPLLNRLRGFAEA